MLQIVFYIPILPIDVANGIFGCRVGKSWKETSHLDDQTNNDELDSKSDGSDNLINKSVGSSSSNHFGNNSYPDESGNRV